MASKNAIDLKSKHTFFDASFVLNAIFKYS